jgi:LysR family hydrogen peroxide-inducible transcriptional activator
MKLRELDYLIALSEQQHFGKAARECHVSQPTLSAQIRKLEDSLGVELVERGTRPLLLTTIGRGVVARARIIQQEIAGIKDLAKSGADPSAVTLRLGIFPTLGPYLMPHVMPTLSDHYTGLEVLLVEDKTAAILAGLRNGTLDVGILALPITQEGLHVEPLFTEDFTLAVPVEHPKMPDPVEVTALADEHVMLLEEGHCLRDQALAVCQVAGVAESDFRATSLEMLRQMVAAGSGVTLLPRLAVRPPVPENPNLRTVDFQPPVPQRQIIMAWRQSSAHRRFLPDLARTFTQSAHNALAGSRR